MQEVIIVDGQISFYVSTSNTIFNYALLPLHLLRAFYVLLTSYFYYIANDSSSG